MSMVGGRYRIPWENEVLVTDGISCGFAASIRDYQPEAVEMRKYA